MVERARIAPIWRSCFQGAMWDLPLGDGHAVVYNDARCSGWSLAIFTGGRSVVEERDVGPCAAAMEQALRLLEEHGLASAHELAAALRCSLESSSAARDGG